MGQQSDSGRQSGLDDKKLRAAGRQQNDPARRAIAGREALPLVGGAFGKQGKATAPARRIPSPGTKPS
jgi:hypothetical protein